MSKLSLFARWLFVLALSGAVNAAERTFDFSQETVNAPPQNFRSTVTGSGKPGDWRIILEDVPPLLAPFTTNAPAVAKRAVVAQLAKDPTDEHFPLLICEDESYGDFTLSTRFKTVSGVAEQMAGLAFRIQDEKNYYVVRASSLGNTLRFYKFVNGVRSEPVGPDLPIPSGVWHVLTIECKGNQIHCLLNGKEAFPMIIDYSFSAGKIGFWTKSDSVSYFAETRINYVPKDKLATVLVRDTLRKYPRLIALRIFAHTGSPAKLCLVGSKDPKELGQPGEKVEKDVVARDVIYTGKNSSTVVVTMPLHDRNGEVAGAVRVTMKPFLGQTEQNAIARALPIVKQMEQRIRSAADLVN
jgi:hypothetical protein